MFTYKFLRKNWNTPLTGKSYTIIFVKALIDYVIVIAATFIGWLGVKGVKAIKIKKEAKKLQKNEIN